MSEETLEERNARDEQLVKLVLSNLRYLRNEDAISVLVSAIGAVISTADDRNGLVAEELRGLAWGMADAMMMTVRREIDARVRSGQVAVGKMIAVIPRMDWSELMS